MMRNKYLSAFALEGELSKTVIPYELLSQVGRLKRDREYNRFAVYEEMIPLIFGYVVTEGVDVKEDIQEVDNKDCVALTADCSRKDRSGLVATDVVSLIDESRMFGDHKFVRDDYDDYSGHGQVKLMLDLLRFLDFSSATKGDCLVYVGAAPCFGSAHCFQSYPLVDFYLYDLKILPDRVLKLPNVWSIPRFDDELVDVINKYDRILFYSDVYTGEIDNYEIQLRYVDLLQPDVCRVKGVVNLALESMPRIEGSLLFVLPFVKSSSYEYSEYFVTSDGFSIGVIETKWLEQYFIWYNLTVRKTRSPFKCKITQCDCYDCMWLGMWLHRFPVRDKFVDWNRKFGLVKFKTKRLNFFSYCVNSVELDLYNETWRIMSNKRSVGHDFVGGDLNGPRLAVTGSANYFSQLSKYDTKSKLSFYRLDCYVFGRWSYLNQCVQYFIFPRCFVVFDYRTMIYHVRYRLNFKMIVEAIPYSLLVRLHSECGECIDKSKYALLASLWKAVGTVVASGDGRYEVLPNYSPLVVCSKH